MQLIGLAGARTLGLAQAKAHLLHQLKRIFESRCFGQTTQHAGCCRGGERLRLVAAQRQRSVASGDGRRGLSLQLRNGIGSRSPRGGVVSERWQKVRHGWRRSTEHKRGLLASVGEGE